MNFHPHPRKVPPPHDLSNSDEDKNLPNDPGKLSDDDPDSDKGQHLPTNSRQLPDNDPNCDEEMRKEKMRNLFNNFLTRNNLKPKVSASDDENLPSDPRKLPDDNPGSDKEVISSASEVCKKYLPTNPGQLPDDDSDSDEEPVDASQPPDDNPDSDEEKITYASELRDQCVEVGEGTDFVPQKPENGKAADLAEYYGEMAFLAACNGKGEAKARICRALYLKDEDGAQAFKAGDAQEALDMYMTALWLLRDDNSNFHPASVDLIVEDSDPSLPAVGRFEGAPDPTTENNKDSGSESAGQMQCAGGGSDAEDEDLKAAMETGAKRYASDAPYAEQASKLRQLLRLNIAACLLKMNDWGNAREACDAVLQREPDQVKALFRKAQACAGEGNTDEAIKAATSVVKLQPNLKEARTLLTKLKKDKEKEKEKTQSTYKNMFSGGHSSSPLPDPSEDKKSTASAKLLLEMLKAGANTKKSASSVEGIDSSHIEGQKASASAKLLFEGLQAGANAKKPGISARLHVLDLFQKDPEEQESILEAFIDQEEGARSLAYELGGWSMGMATELENMLRDGEPVSKIRKVLKMYHTNEMQKVHESMTQEETQTMSELAIELKNAHEVYENADEAGVDKEEAFAKVKQRSEACRQGLRNVREAVFKRQRIEMEELMNCAAENPLKPPPKCVQVIGKHIDPEVGQRVRIIEADSELAQLVTPSGTITELRQSGQRVRILHDGSEKQQRYYNTGKDGEFELALDAD